MGEIVAIGGASGDSGRTLYNNNNDNNNNDNEISFETFYTTTVKQNGYSARVGARHFFKYFSIVSISKVTRVVKSSRG